MLFETFYQENIYRKKIKAIRRYFTKVNKYLQMTVIPKLQLGNKKDGYYEVELPTEKLFEKVYGKMVLKFYVKNDLAYFEDIEPGEILISCYEGNLPVYKGIPYKTKKDLEKIKIMERLL